jgi:hypothetical protein
MTESSIAGQLMAVVSSETSLMLDQYGMNLKWNSCLAETWLVADDVFFLWWKWLNRVVSFNTRHRSRLGK